jgi:hypothetical protein
MWRGTLSLSRSTVPRLPHDGPASQAKITDAHRPQRERARPHFAASDAKSPRSITRDTR